MTPHPRLEVVVVRLPGARLTVGQVGIPAGHVELTRRERDARRRIGGETCARRGLDWVCRREVEAGDVAVFRLRHAELEVVPEAEVQRQTVRDPPVVVNEAAVAGDGRIVHASRLDDGGGSGQAEQKLRDPLAVLIRRGRAGPGELAVERVRAAFPPEIRLLLPQLTPVVAELPRVRARRLRHRRRELDVVERLIASAVEAALLRAERGHAHPRC